MRVQVIKNGRLKTMLSSRTPSTQVTESNGHARRSIPGGGFAGSTTNLIVTAKKGLSQKRLYRKFIQEIKEQELPYGVIIASFDDAAITAAPEFARREMARFARSLDQSAPPPAMMAYRLYANGKKELVRGVQLKPVSVRAWKDVVAAGRKITVKNFLASTETYLIHKLRGVEDGNVPSGGIESAIVTPDLLFRELDINGTKSGIRPLPRIPRP